MKITQSILTASLIIYSVGSANAFPVEAGGPNKTSESNTMTPITIHAGARTPVAAWQGNPALGTHLKSGESIGTLTVFSPGAAQNCSLLIKKTTPVGGDGTYFLVKEGTNGTDGNAIQATLNNTDGSIISVMKNYDTTVKINGAGCNGVVNVLAAMDHNVQAGEYNASLQVIGYTP
ncbi:hypothetical protein GZB42_004257 [Salmonella enterica]|nr:hypothetical protein [Salmonella enterica]